MYSRATWRTSCIKFYKFLSSVRTSLYPKIAEVCAMFSARHHCHVNQERDEAEQILGLEYDQGIAASIQNQFRDE